MLMVRAIKNKVYTVIYKVHKGKTIFEVCYVLFKCFIFGTFKWHPFQNKFWQALHLK